MHLLHLLHTGNAAHRSPFLVWYRLESEHPATAHRTLHIQRSAFNRATCSLQRESRSLQHATGLCVGRGCLTTGDPYSRVSPQQHRTELTPPPPTKSQCPTHSLKPYHRASPFHPREPATQRPPMKRHMCMAFMRPSLRTLVQLVTSLGPLSRPSWHPNPLGPLA